MRPIVGRGTNALVATLALAILALGACSARRDARSSAEPEYCVNGREVFFRNALTRPVDLYERQLLIGTVDPGASNTISLPPGRRSGITWRIQRTVSTPGAITPEAYNAMRFMRVQVRCAG